MRWFHAHKFRFFLSFKTRTLNQRILLRRYYSRGFFQSSFESWWAKKVLLIQISSHFHRPNRPPSKKLTQNRQIRTFFVRTRGIGIPAETSFVLRCCTKNEAHHCLGSKVVQFLIPVWLLIRCGIFRLPTCFTNPLWLWIITTSVRESVALSKQLNRKWLSLNP